MFVPADNGHRMLARERCDPCVIGRDRPPRALQFAANRRIIGGGPLRSTHNTRQLATKALSHSSYRRRCRDCAIPSRYPPRTIAGIANSCASRSRRPSCGLPSAIRRKAVGVQDHSRSSGSIFSNSSLTARSMCADSLRSDRNLPERPHPWFFGSPARGQLLRQRLRHQLAERDSTLGRNGFGAPEKSVRHLECGFHIRSDRSHIYGRPDRAYRYGRASQSIPDSPMGAPGGASGAGITRRDRPDGPGIA